MRFIASGCSLTDYKWTTWADILATSFDEYRNVGVGGADNATIARNLINEAREGDVAVVLWTGFDRWSQWIEKGYPMPKDKENHWLHLGTLVFNKEFWSKYYHPVERFHTMMDYVQLVNLHSQQNNYTAYHFTVFPLFLGESETEQHPELDEIFSKYTIKNNYLKSQPSMIEYLEKNKLTDKVPFEPGGPKDDTHATPLAHWHYLHDVMLPILKVDVDPGLKESIKEEQLKVKRGESWTKNPPPIWWSDGRSC